MEQTINKALAYLGKRFDDLTVAIKSQKLDVNIGEASENLDKASNALLSASQRINLKERDIVIPDNTPMLRKVVDAVEGIYFDTSAQEKTNKLLIEMSRKLDQRREIVVPAPIVDISLDKVEKKLSQLQDSFSELSRSVAKIKLTVPTTFKLDEMQVRAMSSGGVTTTGGVLAARNVTLTNVALTTANTQYTHTFGANVVSWQIRVRDTDVPLLVAFTTGKLPTSGDGAAYFTVPAYYIQETNGVDWSGKKIYLQTGSASQVAEIIEYRA